MLFLAARIEKLSGKRILAQFGRKNEKIVREGGFCLGASLPGSRIFSKADLVGTNIYKKLSFSIRYFFQ